MKQFVLVKVCLRSWRHSFFLSRSSTVRQSQSVAWTVVTLDASYWLELTWSHTFTSSCTHHRRKRVEHLLLPKVELHDVIHDVINSLQIIKTSIVIFFRELSKTIDVSWAVARINTTDSRGNQSACSSGHDVTTSTGYRSYDWRTSAANIKERRYRYHKDGECVTSSIRSDVIDVVAWRFNVIHLCVGVSNVISHLVFNILNCF